MKRNEFFKTGPLFIFVVTAFLLLTGVIGTEITQMNVRFALMLDEITSRGPSMFAALNGIPYMDYFSPWLLCAWVTSLCGRAVTLTGLALPAILLGAYTSMMVYLIGERVRKGIGLCAVLLLLITPEFSALFTGLGIDVPVMAAGVTMLYLLRRRDISLFRFCAVFFLLLLFAFMIRGPLGVILPCAGICGALLATRKWRKFFAAGFTGAAAGILGVACCIGLIFLLGGREWWDWFVRSQIVERVSSRNHYLELFTDIYLQLAPVSLLALGIFLHSRRRIFSHPAADWIGFVVLPLLVMMLPSRVHTRYLALLLPGFALLSSYAWCCGRPGCRLRKILARLQAPIELGYRPVIWFAILILAGAGIFMTGAANQPWGHYVTAFLLTATIPYWTDETFRPFRPLLALGIFLVVAFNPFIAAGENSRKFTTAVESCRTGKVWLLELGPDHDDLKYVLNMAPERRSDVRYVFFEEPELASMYVTIYRIEILEKVLPEIKENDVIVLRRREDEMDGLRAAAEKYHRTLIPIASGTLGHRDFIAVRLGAAPAGNN